ncbi:MAG: pyridoxine 5'-phosphate synthase [bacterium]
MKRLGFYLNPIASFRAESASKEPDLSVIGGIASRYGVDPIIIGCHPQQKLVTERDLRLLKELVVCDLYLLCPGSFSAVENVMSTLKPQGVILVSRHWDGGGTLLSLGDELLGRGAITETKQAEEIGQIVSLGKETSTTVWAFVDPLPAQARWWAKTGLYGAILNGKAFTSSSSTQEAHQAWESLNDAAVAFSKFGLVVGVMGGITLHHLTPLAKIPQIEEFYLEHSLPATALLIGLEKSINLFLSTLTRSIQA